MKKVLPPILFCLFLVFMALICWGLGSPHVISYPYNLLGLPLVFFGLGLAIAGKRHFKKVNTNIMTFGKPDTLVTEGVFKFSRNPMYLGFVVALLGFSVLMGAAISSMLLVGLFLLITDRWYIAFEEQMMQHTFGAAYQNYCHRVRRWI